MKYLILFIPCIILGQSEPRLLSPIDRRFFSDVETQNLDAVNRLLKEHPEININAQTAQGGKTPLYIATQLGNGPLVQALLEHGADPRIPTDGNQTVLELAEKNADPFITDIIKKALANYQNAKGATYDLNQAQEKTNEGIKILKKARKDVVDAANSIFAEIDAIKGLSKETKNRLVKEIERLYQMSAAVSSAGYLAFDIN